MKRSFFAILACSMVLVCGGNDPITSYAQDVEVGSEATSKANREDEWRAEFLAQVERGTISQIKEGLIRSYLTLSAEQERREQGIIELESKRPKGQFDRLSNRLESRIRSGVRRLTLQIDNYEYHKIYLLSRYKLILNKEKLNTSFKNQKISESEYGEKRREIDHALFRLEYLHTIDKATNRIVLTLSDLESGLRHDLYLNN